MRNHLQRRGSVPAMVADERLHLGDLAAMESVYRSAALQRVKYAVARLMCSRAIGVTVNVAFRHRIPNAGVLVDTQSDRISPETVAMLFWGFYESAEIRFVKRFLNPTRDVIELGSSLGVVASHIAKRLQPGVKLVCVEARPDLIDTIACTINLNAPTQSIKIVNAAIDYSGMATVKFALGPTTLSGHTGVTSGPTVDVPAMSLAKVRQFATVGEYSLVSDIEGAELGILLREDLSACRQIIAELHATSFDGVEYSVQDMQRLLEEKHGFRCRAVRGPVVAFDRG